jgi:Na+/melibiose symporter-like transporter
MYAILPNLLLLISLWLLSRYVMTAARHARLRAAIERRDLGSGPIKYASEV